MIKVNLLSPEKKEISGGGGEISQFTDEVKENKINVVAGISAAVLTLGVIGFLFFTQANEIDTKEKLLQEKKARKKQLDTVLKTLEELEKAKKMLDKKVKLIADLKSRQQDAVKMMDQLSNALPDWVWLQSLAFSGKLVSMNGSAIHNNLISDFINNLKGTGSFYDIQFPGSNRLKKQGLDIFNFRLTCYYKDKDQKVPPTDKGKSNAKRRKK